MWDATRMLMWHHHQFNTDWQVGLTQKIYLFIYFFCLSLSSSYLFFPFFFFIVFLLFRSRSSWKPSRPTYEAREDGLCDEARRAGGRWSQEARMGGGGGADGPIRGGGRHYPDARTDLGERRGSLWEKGGLWRRQSNPRRPQQLYGNQQTVTIAGVR